MALSPLCLTDAQVRHVLDAFSETGHEKTHATVWKRRAYAPMYIHDDAMRAFRDEIAARHPDYLIAFDVVFETEGGGVDHHVDHESLGPFHVPNRWRAIRDRHFLSVHVNLTPHGGALVTLDDCVWLSYAYYLVISWAGIFSWAHDLLRRGTTGWVRRWQRVRANDVGIGNAFDNTRLHGVTPGAARTSYVVRLVRRGCGIRLTPASVEESLGRSVACRAFRPLLSAVAGGEVAVDRLDWRAAFAGSLDESS